MKRILTAVMLVLLAAGPVRADDLKKVRGLVESSVNSVLDILRDKKDDKEAKRKKVKGIVDPLFDFKLMGKLVLGRKHWPKLDKKQRKEFTKLFVKQIQDSYFDKVDLLTDEKVEFGDPVRKKKKVHMLTHVVSKDQRYKMLYKLYKKKGAWLVYDVEIEGISIVRSYGSQYDQFLKKSPVKDLLAKMREKALGAPKELQDKKDKKDKGGKEKAKKEKDKKGSKPSKAEGTVSEDPSAPSKVSRSETPGKKD